MSYKEKRKSAAAQAGSSDFKKAKLSHNQRPRPTSASSTAAGGRTAAGATAVNKSQKKFDRKQQRANEANKPQRRVKADDEKPVKVPKNQRPAANPDAETEWDSDPLEESDTGEESGEDDGVSWPSGEENNAMEEDVEDDEEEGGGGVSLSTKPVEDEKTNGTSSREAHAKQRELLKERKAAKPNADEIARSKKLWERLRRSSHVPKDERKKLIAELFRLITGRVREFVLKHDAGRVIQTALKYGTPDQRKMIARELSGEMATLAESKYAKFMIGKLVSYGDKEIRDLVVPDFFGRVRRMIRHPEASWILDDVYRGAASKQQKARLLREWYGAEFSLFAGKSNAAVETAELSEILKEHPEKRKHIMRYLWELINQLVQKKTTGFTMLHDAMLQYHLNTEAGSEEANEFLELLKGDEEHDLMKNLAFTPSGSRVVSLAFAYGTAKDRKLLLRAFKDTVQMMAFDQTAHQVLIAACEVIDDTVMIGKSIFSELLPKDLGAATEEQLADAVALASDASAREVILLPFVERQVAVLRPAEQQRLHEIRRIRESTSKKDAALRKRELAKTLSPPLLQLIRLRAADLVQSSFGCIFVAEVLIKGEGDKSAALAAVADLAASEDETVEAALATPAGGKMLKTLVQGGRFDFATKMVVPCEPRLHFVDALLDRVGLDAVAGWAVGPLTFVVLAMLETADWADAERQAELRQRLRQDEAKLAAAAATAADAAAAGPRQSAGSDKGKGSRSKSKANQSGNKAVTTAETAGGKNREEDSAPCTASVAAKGARLILAAL